MQKKILSFIISLSLVFGASAPSFAVDLATPSSISFKSPSLISDTKATSPSTTVEPEDSSGASYYYAGSNSSPSSATATVSTWAQLVTWITYGFANSVRYLANDVKTQGSVISTAVNDVWTRLGTIIGSVDQIEGYIDSVEPYLVTIYGYLADIKGYTDGIEGYIDSLETSNNSISSNTSNIYNLLDSGLKVGHPIQPYFLPSDSNLASSNWYYDYIPYYNWTGSTAAYFDGNEYSFAMKVKRYFIASVRSLTYIGEQLLTGVKSDNSFNPVYTNSDLTTSAYSKTSFWRSFLEFAQNTSSPLNKLAFVLASDEEIAARQAAQANQDAVVDDFISSSGSASASVSDFADVASAGSSMKSALDSNVSISNAFTAFDSSSSAWDWFSQATADSLDSSSNSRRKGSSDTPMLDSYYSELIETLRLK